MRTDPFPFAARPLKICPNGAKKTTKPKVTRAPSVTLRVPPSSRRKANAYPPNRRGEHCSSASAINNAATKKPSPSGGRGTALARWMRMSAQAIWESTLSSACFGGFAPSFAGAIYLAAIFPFGISASSSVRHSPATFPTGEGLGARRKARANPAGEGLGGRPQHPCKNCREKSQNHPLFPLDKPGDI